MTFNPQEVLEGLTLDELFELYKAIMDELWTHFKIWQDVRYSREEAEGR